MMDCSHHYCRECGVHDGAKHEADCTLAEAELKALLKECEHQLYYASSILNIMNKDQNESRRIILMVASALRRALP